MAIPANDLNTNFPGGRVTLLEMSNGTTTLRYTPHDDDGQNILFGGNTYIPLPMQISNLQITTNGSLPSPVLSLSNVHRTLMSEVINSKNMHGWVVSFFQTLDKYIGSSAHGDKIFNVQRYVITQKLNHTKTTLEFALGHPLSIDAAIPRRIILRENFPSVGKFRI